MLMSCSDLSDMIGYLYDITSNIHQSDVSHSVAADAFALSIV